MMHDEYWRKVREDAHDRLDRLMSGCSTVEEIVGDANGIDSFCDARAVLSYAMEHADDCDERAAAIVAVCEAIHASHELHEGVPHIAVAK